MDRYTMPFVWSYMPVLQRYCCLGSGKDWMKWFVISTENCLKKGAIRWPCFAAGGGASKSSRLALGAYQPMTAGPYETSPDQAAQSSRPWTTPRLRPRPPRHHEPLPRSTASSPALASGQGPSRAPEDWMPVIWGGGEPPSRRSPTRCGRSVDAILSRVTEVYQQLREDPGAYRPVFRVADEWCRDRGRLGARLLEAWRVPGRCMVSRWGARPSAGRRSCSSSCT